MQGNYIEDYFLIGGIAVIGLAEVAHLGAMFTGQSFSGCVMLLGILLVLLVLACILWIGIRGRKLRTDKKNAKNVEGIGGLEASSKRAVQGAWVVFALLVAVQIVQIGTQEAIYPGGDLTAETVESMLTTNSFYQVNPMTGHAYTAGVPSRLKILCLPTLYASICQILHLSAEVVVWKMVPILVLLGSYLAYHILAKIFWRNNAKGRAVFMVLVALIFLCGDYLYGMDGFGVMHGGYRGVTIRGCILLPYVFGLCLRKKWLTAFLCVLAEACIVWTLYGMGACLLVILGTYLVTALLRRAGKEGLQCRSS